MRVLCSAREEHPRCTQRAQCVINVNTRTCPTYLHILFLTIYGSSEVAHTFTHTLVTRDLAKSTCTSTPEVKNALKTLKNQRDTFGMGGLIRGNQDVTRDVIYERSQ